MLHVLHPVLPHGWLPKHIHRWWEQTFADGLCADAESLPNFAGLGETTKNWAPQGTALGKTNRRFSTLGLALQDWEKTCKLKNSPAGRKERYGAGTTIGQIWESLRVLVGLTGEEGISPPKLISKDWRMWLLLQMQTQQCKTLRNTKNQGNWYHQRNTIFQQLIPEKWRSMPD